MDGSFSYGVILKEPLLAFSSAIFDQRPEITSENFNNIAFQLWVRNSVRGKDGCPILGNISIYDLIVNKPIFYRYDMISMKFYHYVDCINDIPSTREDCIGLECAAVWERVTLKGDLWFLKKDVESSLREEKKA